MADQAENVNIDNENDREFLSATKFSKQWSVALTTNLNTKFGKLFETLESFKLSLEQDIIKCEQSLSQKIAANVEKTARVNQKSIQNELAIQEIRQEMTSVRKECAELKLENEKLRQKSVNLETYSRRDNLVIHGIKFKQNESQKECADAVRVFMKTILKIPVADVDTMRFTRCHRLKPERSSVFPIIVRFHFYSDRELVWGMVKDLPPRGQYYMSEDYPRSVLFNRKKLLPIFNRARKSLGKHEVSLKGDILRISKDTYNVNNLHQLKGDLNPRSFTRKSNENMLVFGGCYSEAEPLSNWGKFPVVHDGKTFRTLEHGFVYNKCIINGNKNSANRVLDAPEPYMVKQISDKIKINTNVWTSDKSEEVMTSLLEAKFAPNTEMATELLATGDKYLAESGRSKYYACGLSITHPDVLKKDAHTGKNRLGDLLMARRRVLR